MNPAGDVVVGKGDPHELLRQYLAIYDSYHNHKEMKAYTVTALYLGGAAVFVTTPPFWSLYGVPEFVLLASFVILLAALAFWFVRHQLMLRRSAGGHVQGVLPTCQQVARAPT